MEAIKNIRLATSVKCGRKEDTVFFESDAKSELVAVKIPVVNGQPGEYMYQAIIKMTSKTPNPQVTYTSLANVQWWTWPEDALKPEEKPKRVRSKPTEMVI